MGMQSAKYDIVIQGGHALLMLNRYQTKDKSELLLHLNIFYNRHK